MKISITPTTQIRRAANLLASQMDDEYLVMSIELGSYISLRDVSARIWEILEQPHTMTSLTALLLTEYVVDPDVCQKEVAAFVQQMAEARLLAIDPVP